MLNLVVGEPHPFGSLGSEGMIVEVMDGGIHIAVFVPPGSPWVQEICGGQLELGFVGVPALGWWILETPKGRIVSPWSMSRVPPAEQTHIKSVIQNWLSISLTTNEVPVTVIAVVNAMDATVLDMRAVGINANAFQQMAKKLLRLPGYLTPEALAKWERKGGDKLGRKTPIKFMSLGKFGNHEIKEEYAA
jgi:hypothetical protein